MFGMGDRMRSILFIYSGEQTRKYLCLSAFFSINGYFTWGERLFEDQADEIQIHKNDVYDVVVNLSGKMIPEESGCSKLIDCSHDEEKILAGLIEELNNRDKISDQEKVILEPLIQIYEKYHLREMEYNSQFYYQEEEEAENAYCRFYDACSEIRKLMDLGEMKENPESWHLWYARGHCMRRMHELAETINRRKIYNIGAYVEKMQQTMKMMKWEDIASLYALMGYLWDTVSQKSEPSYEYYKKCISLITDSLSQDETVGFISPVYYRIGRDYEKKEDNQIKAYQYYSASYQCNNHNYRALYKKAFYDNKKGLHDYAKKEYDSLKRFFEKIEDEFYLQSIEMEYLYKVYWCLTKMPQTSEEEKIEIKNRISKMSEKKENEFYFFGSFYSEEECGKYFGYMKKRMEKYKKILM